MIHELRLNPIPYDLIKLGRQKIETRLFDEKRSIIQVGDTIIFRLRPDGVDSFPAEVIGLSIFKTFKDLFENTDKIKLGYKKDDTLEYQISCMRKYYSKEDEIKYGVVGIHLKI